MIQNFEEDLNLVLDNTRNSWSKIKGKTIFVTGGTGFFGIWLLMSFIFINRELALSAKIILLTRDKSSFLRKYDWVSQYAEISFLEGDINNFEFIQGEIDYVIHAATEASDKLNKEAPLIMFETVVNGTKRVLEFARLKKVKSLLLTSSGAVYGVQPSEIKNICEDYVGAPITTNSISTYGESKRMAELLCSIYNKQFDLPVKIARCYAFVGPFLPLDTHFAVGNFLNNLFKKEDIIIEGDGTPYRSYMYSADLVIWLWTILFEGENNSAYNVGSDKSISISELAELISKYDNENHTKVVIKSPVSNKPVLRYVPNIDKAKEKLELKLFTDLESSIEKMIRFNEIAKMY